MNKIILLAALLSLSAIPALAQTAPVADEAGVMTTLQGSVEQITDTNEFIMKDATGMVKVDIGDAKISLKVGDQVTVEGLVETDLQGRDMEAQSLTGPDGKVVTITHDSENGNDGADTNEANEPADANGTTETGNN